MQLRHIVVPLDGSHLAEAALPMARRIAAGARAHLTLLHVLEERPPASVHGQRHLGSAADAEQYLSSLRDGMHAAGLDVFTHVHENTVRDVAQSLSDHAAELHADLIVMTTHGTGGMRRLVFGSIAQQVIASAVCPVLFLPCESSDKQCSPDTRHVFVPLDGDPRHECAVPLAVALATALDAAVRLLTVVPNVADLAGSRSAVARFMPGATATALDLEADAAAAYLASVRNACIPHSAGPDAGASAAPDLVERGDPARVIRHVAEHADPAMLVMATHRRVGAAAFWNASVAPRVAAEASCPVAMVSVPSVIVVP